MMRIHERGLMRQIDEPPPNLGQRRGPWRGGMSSRDWVPRNMWARLGVFIFGAIYVICALSMIAASFLLKRELRASIASPVLGFLASLFAVMAVLCIAWWLLWFGSRLLRSSFRHFTMRGH
jgi:VIT1/CCC1 family predicted Fe2+/Mn2+ transporter